MSDKELGLVLDSYPLKVKRIKAWFPDFWLVETKGEVYWLKKTSTKVNQLSFINSLLTALKDQGLVTYQGLAANKEGNIFFEAEGDLRYYLLQAVKGKRGKLNNSPHWQSIARFLARFHNAQDQLELEKQPIIQVAQADSYLERFRERHKELTTLQVDHVNGRKTLEKELVISHLDYFVEQSEEALERINTDEVEELVKEEKRHIALRQVHPANFVFHKDIVQPINWEFIKHGVRIYDLGRLLKMAGYLDHWSVEKGKIILEAYQAIRPLSKAEKSLLKADILFPRYYWLNSRKIFKEENPGDAYKRLRRTILDEGKKVKFINQLEGLLK